ncbi:hypothetical protein M419DRAFT_122629 [Trichoderma reesei RUT C-30]|uniref:Uncharacterized protein n=1 Tax=Hypocrea jecorina (strain ATCC 56765 / BCRC 32924 / NRRL 11460 / Rut C-30) TaxID=1344414 RepID=A0A024SFB7_HYPJR|nr:hypothetical protein M419DRAFT_122629 [Trichoderma reesei RUT C-30]
MLHEKNTAMEVLHPLKGSKLGNIKYKKRKRKNTHTSCAEPNASLVYSRKCNPPTRGGV